MRSRPQGNFAPRRRRICLRSRYSLLNSSKVPIPMSSVHTTLRDLLSVPDERVRDITASVDPSFLPKWRFLDASSPSQLSRSSSVGTVLRAMTAPNIEMIAALLRSCNLGRGGDRVSPPSAAAHRVEASGESAGQVMVELNSETALPYHWEQCLDMRVSGCSLNASLHSPIIDHKCNQLHLQNCCFGIISGLQIRPTYSGHFRIVVAIHLSLLRQICLISERVKESLHRFWLSSLFRTGSGSFDLGSSREEKGIVSAKHWKRQATQGYYYFLILYSRLSPAKLPLFPWQTGEVYYINRATGTRTSKDPRTASAAAATYSSSYQSEEDVSSDDFDSCSGIGGSDDHEDSIDTATSCLTSLSSTSSTSDTGAEPSGGQILVSAGCRSCFMYFMVPKSTDACPKCGGRLLKLGRDGCV
ncbi:hypothetical protein GW17_00051576 [Ensete ventricosum]|nr:hypothetical protein GW17_00051576 [Ensete ventricosum]